MIKKSIASILIFLILINSIGCYSYNQIMKEDTKKIEENDKVRITTLDEKVFVLTDVTIEGSEVTGFVVPTQWKLGRDIHVEVIVISFKEIKNIEIKEHNTGLTVLTVVLVLGVTIAVLAIAMVNADWEK